MPSTKDLIQDETVQCLVFGMFKSGKTFGALSFPRPNVIDFDHGIRTLLNKDFVAKYGVRNVEFFQPKRILDGKGVPANYNAFDSACLYFDEWMKPGKVDKFDTWVLDSATSLIDASTDKAIILLGGKLKGSLSNTYEQAKMHGIVVPKRQDYGAERSMTESFIRMLKDSGKNVVVICHEREITNDSGSVTAVVPLLTGKSQQDVPIMFDEVYRLTVKPSGTGMARVLQTQPSGAVKVGSRLGVPTDTAWDYDTLHKIITDLRTEQKRLAESGTAPAAQPATPLPVAARG